MATHYIVDCGAVARNDEGEFLMVRQQGGYWQGLWIFPGGKLEVGDINFLVAIAAAHRKEGFAAAQYAVDRFKELMPTRKKESYRDGSTHIEGE